MADEIKLHRDETMIHDHIKLMNDNQNRSQSNTHRLDAHEKKLDELFKVHTALNSMQTEISHISKKLDNIGDVSQLQEQQMELESAYYSDMIQAITGNHPKDKSYLEIFIHGIVGALGVAFVGIVFWIIVQYGNAGGGTI